MKISIIGMGYVGLPLAVEFGKHFDVVGFDIDKNRVQDLSNGKDVTKELNPKQIKSSKKLVFSYDESDLFKSDFFIVTVPTPIDETNKPNLDPIKNASRLIANSLKKGSIIIYESTVYPGCTEEICVPILEESKLKYNTDFFCGYSPERIVPGDKKNTLTKIIKIVSGSNPYATKKINSLYKKIIKAGTHQVSSIKVAEAIKVIENTQRDLNIALINELSVIFNRLDIDTIEVIKGASTKWNFLPFMPGMVGGHCIGVDPYYLTHKAEQVKYNPQVILAGRRINDNMAKYAGKMIVKMMAQNSINLVNSSVAVLGFTFKENCPDTRNTKVIDLINELREWGVKPYVIDPWADPVEVENEFGIKLMKLNASKKFDSVVVAVGHKEFRSLTVREIRKFCKGNKPVLADLKSLYKKDEIQSHGFSGFSF